MYDAMQYNDDWEMQKKILKSPIIIFDNDIWKKIAVVQ